MTGFTESTVEEAALNWLESVGWQVAHGPDIASDQLLAERTDCGEVVLARRLRDALLPKLISGELRLPTALCERAAQAGVKDAEKFLKERGL